MVEVDVKFSLTALVLATAAPGSAAQAQVPAQPEQTSRTDEAAILDAINAFFAAVEAKDQARILAAVNPDGLATSVLVDGDRQPRIRNWHWNGYYGNIASQGRFTERMMSPLVRVERDIAMVWGPYELHIDGVFTQCGVNHFDMVRSGGKWLIYNLTWTNQRAGCPGRG
jgi:ketosteroid isomerase-like protein